MSSGEKKRLEQYLLQSRASNIITVDPRYNRFQPQDINRIRLLQSQRLAGQVPISERLKKEQKKKKKKARKTKNLKGDLARNLTEQRRFVKGERRDKDTEEPRIVGDPKPVPVGLGYDPEIERRRLDIQQAVIDQNRLDRIADRAEGRRRQEAELGVRRGELAAGRADRALIRGALAPAPIAILPPAPAIDPVPEIIRLGDRLRGDYNAFGQEQDARNRDEFARLREQQELDNIQTRQALESIEARQQAQDENRRADQASQDARYQEVHERLGAGERALGEGRTEVLREIRGAEDRLRGAQGELDRPSNYDDVILQAVQSRASAQGEARTPTPGSRFEEVTPTPTTVVRPSPSLARPNTPVSPVSLEEVGVVEGGGELNLPPVLVGGSPEQQERLRLSPAEQARIYPAQRQVPGRGPTDRPAGSLRNPSQETDAARALRLGRLAIEEAEPVLQEEEADDPRLRLTSTQDFLSGFARPSDSGPASPQSGGARESPGTRSQRAARNLPVREEAIESPEGVGSPRPAPLVPSTPSTPEEEALLREAYEGEQEEESPRARSGQVAEGIAQFGGVAPSARVIEDAGVQALSSSARGTVQSSMAQARGQVESEEEEEGEVLDLAQQRLRESKQIYDSSFSDLTSQVRPGPRGARGERGGMGYRVRNNTDRRLKRVEPGDVVNVIGVEGGERGRGVYRLDTQTAAGTRVGLDQFGPLVDDGSFLFERGHRHELGGHFDREEYGAPSVEPLLEEVAAAEAEPGLLQQGAEAAGGAVAAVVGGAGRLAGGLALGAAQGVAEQLPSAGDVGAALGRGAVGAVAGTARLAGAGGAAVAGALGGGEEPEVDLEEI